MTHIYITRHGETDWNRLGKTQGSQDTFLSDVGNLQARHIARRLEGEGITRIYASDLSRAYETAKIIGTSIGVMPVREPALREIHFGCWEGLTIQEIEATYPGQLDAWHHQQDFCPTQGESILALGERLSSFILKLDRENAETSGNVLLVSHGITNRVLILSLMGMPFEYLWSFRQDNTGISIIKDESGKRTIVCLNDTCHLSQK